MFGEWLDVVSLLELSVIIIFGHHLYQFYLFMSNFTSQPRWLQNSERWCSFTCFSNAAVNLNLFIHDFYATEIKHLQAKSFVCFLYMTTEVYYWYICINVCQI